MFYCLPISVIISVIKEKILMSTFEFVHVMVKFCNIFKYGDITLYVKMHTYSQGLFSSVDS